METRFPTRYRISERLLCRDKSSDWLLRLSFAVEIILVIFTNDASLMGILGTSYLVEWFWALYSIVLTVIILQLLVQLSLLRPVFPIILIVVPALPFPHCLNISVLTFLCLLIDIMKTLDRSYLNEASDNSNWASILHYIAISLRVILTLFLSRRLVNSVMIACWFALLWRRSVVYRFDATLKWLHQNMYVVCIALIIEDFVKQYSIPQKCHFLLLAIFVLVFNLVCLLYYRFGGVSLNWEDMSKGRLVDGVRWMLGVLYAKSFKPQECRAIQDLLRSIREGPQSVGRLPELKIATKETYINAIVDLFRSQQQPQTIDYFLLSSEIALKVKHNCFSSLLFYEQACRTLPRISLFDRLHLYRLKLDVFQTFELQKNPSPDYTEFFVNEQLIGKIRGCSESYKDMWLESSNADFCVVQRLQQKIDGFIHSRNQVHKQFTKLDTADMLALDTRRIYACFAYFVNKDLQQTQKIIEKLQISLERITNSDHSNSLSMKVSLMEQKLGEIISIGSNSIKFVGFDCTDLKNISLLIPNALRDQHERVLINLVKNGQINSDRLYRLRKPTFCSDREGHLQQITLEFNLFYDFENLYMAGRIIFRKEPQKFISLGGSSEQTFSGSFSCDSSLDIVLEIQPKLMKEVSLGQQKIDLHSLHLDVANNNPRDILEIIALNQYNYLQNSGIHKFLENKENTKKDNYGKNRVIFIISLIGFFVSFLLLNIYIKRSASQERMFAQLQTQLTMQYHFANQFRTYQILLNGIDLIIHKGDSNYYIQKDDDFLESLKAHRTTVIKLDKIFKIYIKQLLGSQEVTARAFLQLKKINSAVASAYSALSFSQNQDFRQAQSFPGFYSASFSSLQFALTNTQNIVQVTLPIIKSNLQLDLEAKKLYFKTKYSTIYSVTILKIVALAILVFIAQRFTQVSRSQLVKGMMSFNESEIYQIVRGVHALWMVLDGMKIQNLYVFETVLGNSQLYRVSSNNSFTNNNSNMEFRLNTEMPFQLSELKNTDFGEDDIIDREKSSFAAQNKIKATSVSFMATLSAATCLAIATSTVPFIVTNQPEFTVNNYWDSLLNLESLPIRYFHIYTAFLEYADSGFTNSSFYKSALAKYPSLTEKFSTFNYSFSDNSYFTAFNRLKFNIDNSPVCSFRDCSSFSTLNNQKWKNQLANATILDGLARALEIMAGMVKEKPSPGDERYHLLIEAQVLYLEAFQDLINLYLQNSYDKRISLFNVKVCATQIQRMWYFIQLGTILIFAFFLVTPVCVKLYLARRNMKIVFNLLSRENFKMDKVAHSINI